MNVTEKQLDEAVQSVLDILQLEPDLSNQFYTMLVKWLDENDVEVIE